MNTKCGDNDGLLLYEDDCEDDISDDDSDGDDDGDTRTIDTMPTMATARYLDGYRAVADNDGVPVVVFFLFY